MSEKLVDIKKEIAQIDSNFVVDVSGETPTGYTRKDYMKVVGYMDDGHSEEA
jgi:hypothetical protein